MKDSADERLDRLFAAVRVEPVDTAALQEHFETRLMARIHERCAASTPWYLLAWRAIPVFAMIAVVITIAAYSFTIKPSNDMFAAITGDQDEIYGSGYLIGE